MTEENKNYDPHATEAKWRDQWVKNQTFAWNPAEGRDTSFIVDTPPPTASGSLHIGHVYSYTQTDVTARFMRMTGKNVFYPLGYDDNGLPTERMVEKEKNVRAADMVREDFIALCHELVDVTEARYTAAFQALGLSVDWDQNYQTIAAPARRLSQLSVIDLYNKGHVYRQMQQPGLWDPADQTAIAQSEVVEKETPGTMWTLRFALEKGGEIHIATTRPELIGADIGVVIHPDHPRAAELVGQYALSPLFNVPLLILADEKADPEKGTGIAMVSTWGDVTDIEWWRRHNLPTRVILDKQGRINAMEGLGTDAWPSRNLTLARQTADALRGLSAKQARAKMAELLAEAGLVIEEKAVTRMVPCAERSGAPLEIIVTPQWFVKVLDKKAELIEMGRKIKWTPEFMRVRFEQWTEGLKWDWCISRQRHFGVPLPFWYSKRAGEEGKIIAAAPDQLPVDPLVDLPAGYSRDEVEPERDVMDTWATSSISPQLSSHGITPDLTLDAARHSKLYPAHMRPQGHEIIRTWAFYTIVKSYLHQQSVPWDTIAVSGWCLAQDKTKMSKSKGNVIRPEDLFAEYNVDVVRYWAANCRLGTDTAFDPNTLKVGKRLQNKLWNAARFAALQLQGFTPRAETLAASAADITHPLDKWISTKLAATIAQATRQHAAYDYADALKTCEQFFWGDLCDNYLELVKARAYGEVGNAADKLSAQTTLYFVLEATLRLFAPVMSFITEELYSTLFPALFAKTGSIHARGMWPKTADYITDSVAEAEGDTVVALLAALRKAKSNANVSIKTPVTTFVVTGGVTPPSAASLADLCAAGGSAKPEFATTAPAGLMAVASDDGTFTAHIALAAQEKGAA